MNAVPDVLGLGHIMSEADLESRTSQHLDAIGLAPSALDALASQLLWRVGKVADDAPVTVRVGFATSAALFADLPKLRSASDAEVEQSVQDGSLRVEWVGHRPR